MPLIVSGISLPFMEPSEFALDEARRIAGLPGCPARISRRAVDARHKKRIQFVYSVALEPGAGLPAALPSHPQIRLQSEPELDIPAKNPPREQPVIAGFGPAGMFAGLILARAGWRPLILERGAEVDRRVAAVERFWATGELCENSNVQFGEGGAGTFSDGKLTTRIGDPFCAYVLRELANHGAPESILTDAKPHIGTDRLRIVLRSLRSEILALGGEVMFGTPLLDIIAKNGRVTAAKTPLGELPARVLLLAPGHSARDTFAVLRARGVQLEPKPFSAGARIEHLQSEIDAALYGEFAGHPLLPRGEYQLSLRNDGGAVYTFCMCPGGVVVPAASERDGVVTNGMSDFARAGANANSALVASVGFPTAEEGIEFQRGLERRAFAAGGGMFHAPAQDVGSFLAGKSGLFIRRVQPSYGRGATPADIAGLFPREIAERLRGGIRAFGKRLPGFDSGDAILTGVETRTSSPVRVPRGEDFQSPDIAGLFPCGEGAGYAGGIMSAAVDGIRAAMAVMESQNT